MRYQKSESSDGKYKTSHSFTFTIKRMLYEMSTSKSYPRILTLLPLFFVVLNAFTLPAVHNVDSLSSASSTQLYSAINNVDWGRKTVLQLQKELRSRGLSDRGSKTDLIQRLQALNTVKDQKDSTLIQVPAAPPTAPPLPTSTKTTSEDSETSFENQKWVETGSEEEKRIENYLRKHKQKTDDKQWNNKSANERMNTIIDVTSTSTPTSTATPTSDTTANRNTHATSDQTQAWKNPSSTKPRNGSTQQWKKAESRQFLSIDKDDFLKPYDAAIEMNAIDTIEEASSSVQSSMDANEDNNVQPSMDTDTSTDTDTDTDTDEDNIINGSPTSENESPQATATSKGPSSKKKAFNNTDGEFYFETSLESDKDIFDENMQHNYTAEASSFTTSWSRDEPYPFEVLGVEPGATMAEIKAAYREKAMQFHPDKNLDNQADAAENFRQLVEAFQVLNGGYKKGKYEKKEYEMLQRLQRRRQQEKTKDKDDDDDSFSQKLKTALPPHLYEKLAESTQLGEPTLFPVQEKSYEAIVSGQNVVLNSPRGSGKTLGYLLPLLASIHGKEDKEETIQNPQSSAKRGRRRRRNRRSRLKSELDAMNQPCTPVILILTPSTDIAKHVGKMCLQYHNTSDHVATIFEGIPKRRQLNILQNSNLEIVVGTPGRIEEYIKQGTINMSGLKSIILDEADELLPATQKRSGIESILNATTGDCQTILASATMPNRVLDFCQNVMGIDKTDSCFVTISAGENEGEGIGFVKDGDEESTIVESTSDNVQVLSSAEGISFEKDGDEESSIVESTSDNVQVLPSAHHWHTATRSADRAMLALDLIATIQPRTGVVFAASQSEVLKVASALALSSSASVAMLSEGMTQEEQDKVVSKLQDSNSSKISNLVVTTDTASCDVTFPGVDLVLQFGIPRKPENDELYDASLYISRTKCLGQFEKEESDVGAILLYDYEDEGRLLPGLQTELEVENGIIMNPRALPSPQNILEASYSRAKEMCNHLPYSKAVVDSFEKQLSSELSELDLIERESELLHRLAVAMVALSDLK